MQILYSKRARTVFSLFLLAKLVFLGLALSIVLRRNHSYATCNDCFCIPEEGELCPNDRLPRSNFTALLPKLRMLHHENPVILTCDPYQDAQCNTEPALRDGGGACIVEYAFASIDSCPHSYRLRTYAGSYEEALEEGHSVTHAGPCGACSSLQDLAVYMEQGAELRQSSTVCGLRGRLSEADGVACFQEMGFTDSCANIWFYNTRNTAKHCMGHCAPFLLSGRGPNRDEPGCPLETCIHCDEIHSGPNFKRFAGRTRRNSGLRSNIARPCSEMVVLEQADPCDQAATASAMILTPAALRPLQLRVDNIRFPHHILPDVLVQRHRNSY